MDTKNIEDITALTPMQDALLFHYLMSRGSSMYFQQLCLDLRGPWDMNLMEQTWNIVQDANEALRTVFRWERTREPVQVILKEHQLQVRRYDFPGTKIDDNTAKETWFHKIKIKDKKDLFDLHERGFRVTLCRLGKEQVRMIISYHHILLDGWSLGIILEEFFYAYREFADNETPIIPVKTRYREYVKWIKRQDIKKQKLFWEKYLEDFDTVSVLPIKKPGKTSDGPVENFTVICSGDTKERLECFITDHKITLAAVMFSAWGILLQRYLDTRDVVFGTTVSGRPAAIKGIESMVGVFINTLPLRVQSYSSREAIEILRIIHEELQSRQLYEICRLVDIKEWTGWDNNRELFDTIIVVENYPLEQVLMNLLPGMPVNSYSMEEITNYDLTICITMPDNIKINFCYQEKAFDKEVIKRLSRHFTAVLEGMLHDPGQPVDKIEIVSPGEKTIILYEFNKTGKDYPANKTIHQLFRVQVEKTPDRVALMGQIPGPGSRVTSGELPGGQSVKAFGKGFLSYKELDKKSHQLARLLDEKGVRFDTIVGIMVERSLEMIIGILGILKSGGAYLPIDPAYPQERIKYMLEDSGAKILLSAGDHPDHSCSRLSSFSHLFIFPGSRFPTFSHPGLSSWMSTPSACLAYLIYTSGTTGKPKGVVIEHHSLVNRLYWMQEKYPLGEDDVILHKTPFTFDVSVWEIFWWALVGAKVCLLVPGGEKDPGITAGTVVWNRVTVMHFVPSMLTAFLGFLEENDEVFRLSCLRQVFCSGEVLAVSQVKRFNDLLFKPYSTRLANLYGPTEATIDVSYYDCLEREDEKIIPIGKPINNIQLYILDRNLQLQPEGIPGELCIGGVGLSRGYLNNPGLTTQKFINYKLQNTNYKQITNYNVQNYKPNAIHTSMQSCTHAAIQHHNHSTTPPLHHSPIYQTGDLARWLEGGNIEFLGRMDRQVKIRGFRIELEEIERRLLAHHRIKEAVVVTQEDMGGDRYLCAYIVPGEAGGRESFRMSDLRDHLLKTLPGYMIPVSFMILDKLPLGSSGKIDRRVLPRGRSLGESIVMPGDEIEQKLADIWEQVLSRDILIGIDSNFFTLGGHSLKAISLVAWIHRVFKVKFPLGEVFKRPFIRQQAQFIKKAVREHYVPIHAVESKEYYALSSAQKRLYFLHQVEKTTLAYNMSSVLELAGNLELDRLENTFKELLKRHESLRTSFGTVNGDPVQRIHTTGSLFQSKVFGSPEPFFQKGFWPPEAVISNIIKPFNLSQAPLLRVRLLQSGQETHLLIVDMHHIISDAVSLDIFIKDFIAIYVGEVLPASRIFYKDYSQWQNSEKEKERIKSQEGFWVRELGVEVPILDLPLDRTRPMVQGFKGRHLDFQLEEEATRALKKLALEEDATIYMVLIAIFNILLAKISGQEDIIVGSPVAGRRHVDIGHIIGMFVNTLALRNYPSGDKPFTVFLREVRERVLAVLDNQDYPFEDVVEKVLGSRDAARNPLFDVMFVLQNAVISDIDLAGLTLRRREYEIGISKFDLTYTCEEVGERLIFTVEFSTELFLSNTIQGFINYFKKIAAVVVGNKDIRIGEIEILSVEERAQLLFDFNDTATWYPGERRLHQLFEIQVDRAPDHRALISGEGQMTYMQLNTRSNQLAWLLRGKGVGLDTIVAVMLEPSLETVIAILAILKAGGAYLPLDPGYPQPRIFTMLNGSGANILLTGGKVKGCKELLREFHGDIILVDRLGEEPGTYSPGNLPGIDGNGNLFYVIYTSGSTGVPKGAGVYQRGFMNLVHWFVTDFSLGHGDINLVLTSLSFDLTQKNLYAPLVTGGVLCFSGFNHFDPGGILEVIKDNGVTWINCTPSMLYMLVEYEEAGKQERMSGLRYVFLGGEPIWISKLIRWLESGSCQAEVVNTYGPTECTDICAFYRIKEPQRFLQKNVPIGKPINNARLFVLDHGLRPVPLGIAGELAIGGEGVGPGYLDDEILTSEKFIDLDMSYPSSMTHIYRSGDRVKRLPDGNIEFLGRMDLQVKIRGYRVELGEIENVLLSHDRVKEAAAAVVEDSEGGVNLCAYVVPAVGRDIDEESLRKHAADTLPDYMVPTYFVTLEKIPLTPNGKINRNQLPRPEIKPGKGYMEPRDGVEKKLVEIWAEVLELDKEVIGIEANFFEIGGNSLKINHINSEARKVFKKDIPLVALFEYPTIKSFSNYLSTLSDAGPRESFTGPGPEGFKTREKNPNRLRERNKRMRS